MPTINFWILPGVPPAPKPKPIDSEYIIDTIIRIEDVNKYKIFGRNRKRELVFARQLICWFLKRYTKLTLKAIGDLMGGRDHTTVIHSIKTINDLHDSDPAIRNLLLFYDKKFKHEQRPTKGIIDLLEEGREMAKA